MGLSPNTSAGIMSSQAIYQRLLAIDPLAAKAYADSQYSLTVGQAILAAQSASDAMRATRLPRPERVARDIFRTR